MALKPESSYRLKAAFGSGMGEIPAGAEVSVLYVVPPHTPGVGDSRHETVVVEYRYEVQVLDENDVYRSVMVPRSLSLPVPQFEALFEEVVPDAG